jgi:hypothetical protein
MAEELAAWRRERQALAAATAAVAAAAGGAAAPALGAEIAEAVLRLWWWLDGRCRTWAAQARGLCLSVHLSVRPPWAEVGGQAGRLSD